MTDVCEQPVPCKEGDHGKFEVKARDGWARVGEYHTSRHILRTPTLLPVVNPNIQTISPAELWEMGFQGLITNSYIIWKSEQWKEKAKSEGVHAMLDYPGLVMTDSGTFQQYVYGDDVEIGPEEIVEFQRKIGVDIATMLDIFGRPDMSRGELEEAVRVTAERGPPALEAAAGTLLNGPIQGGTHADLRQEASALMSDMGFAVHPIGGIVPLMENQRYTELVEVIVTCKQHLPPDRPVHLFGCGHPLLFPIAVALGVDLFDSAAYVLFARDGRLLTPTGTVRLDDLREWPHTSPALWGVTPEQVRKMSEGERVELLARHNLHVTLSELRRCQQAVWDGTIWTLVEERSHCNPQLRAATIWVYENAPSSLLLNSQSCRAGGIPWSTDLIHHPRIRHAHEYSNWSPPPTDHLGREQGYDDWYGVVFHGREGPWREKIGDLVEEVVRRWPRVMPFVYTPIGVIPYQLEDLNPFAHIVGPQMLWDIPDEMFSEGVDSIDEMVQQVHLLPSEQILVHHVESSLEGLHLRLEELHGQSTEVEDDAADICGHFQRWAIRDKISLFTWTDPEEFEEVTGEFKFVMSRTGRITNVLLDGVHLFSPRLTDGGLSLTMEGAKWIHELRRWVELEQADGLPEQMFIGMPEVVVNSDAEPFVRDGRNVMHGFIVENRGRPTTGMPCLVVNEAGELLGHGTAQGDSKDMMAFRKGVAVKVRDGVGPSGD